MVILAGEGGGERAVLVGGEGHGGSGAGAGGGEESGGGGWCRVGQLVPGTSRSLQRNST